MKSDSKPPTFIVLTGGPGAGKTATLEFIRKMVNSKMAILPEAASILFQGGFWRLPSESGQKSIQRAIYHVQNEMQNLVLQENKWTYALCDRGTLDGSAYWPSGQDDFYQSFKTSQSAEYSKYLAVIHLQSPSIEQGYNHQNPIRTESAELAATIDNKIHLIWKDHPHYHQLTSTNHFFDKVSEAIRIIQNYMPSGFLSLEN